MGGAGRKIKDGPNVDKPWKILIRRRPVFGENVRIAFANG
jgi:hypothetical protein